LRENGRSLVCVLSDLANEVLSKLCRFAASRYEEISHRYDGV
jgi:hypothetical protein